MTCELCGMSNPIGTDFVRETVWVIQTDLLRPPVTVVTIAHEQCLDLVQGS